MHSYICSNFNDFVSPQEVVKLLKCTDVFISFSNEKCSVKIYLNIMEAILAYTCQLSHFKRYSLLFLASTSQQSQFFLACLTF